MHLENIKLEHFKNYSKLETNFSTQINCIVGENGSGKTNLLDAIHYLALTKSAFNAIDSQNINHTKDYFFIQGNFLVQEKKIAVQCSFQTGQKKLVKLNQKPYEKISDHIGQIPLVIITPDDQSLVKEGSETRRKFFDSLISQIDQKYLQNLINYYKILKHRNSLLKQFAERNFFDADLLHSYTDGIHEYGIKIYQRRNQFMERYLSIFQNYYAELTQNKEKVQLSYQSDAAEDHFKRSLFHATEKDRILQRTTLGIHKDDFIFEINGYPLKKFGSQGQQKSFVVALKLAELEEIMQQKSFTPILLLDDIFDKLDEQRINRLMDMAAQKRFGQIFITDARPERTEKILNANQLSAELLFLKEGEIVNKKKL